MDSNSIRLDGFEELSKMIEGLSDVASKAVVKSALRAAVKPIIKSARSKVRSYSKTVADSININYISKDGSTIGVGPKKKGFVIENADGTFDLSNIKDPWFAHFIEYGTSGVGRFKGKRSYWLGSRGDVRSGRPIEKRTYRPDQPARPFMRPAFEENREKILEEFSETVKKALDKYLKNNYSKI
jgi:HK97 gp10 family phage protein